MSLTTYNVDAGKDRATIELSGETKVVFSFDPNIIAVEAVSGEVNVSLDEGATAGDDGCDTLSDGQSTRMNPIADKCIYVNGTGTVKVWGGRSGEDCPFPKSGKGGGSGGGCNYKGTTTTPISNGSTTNPITIDGEEYTAVFGDIVVYGYTEFVFDGTAWSEFGRPFDTTPTSGSANAVTSDGIYQVTPLKRGSGSSSVTGGTNTTAQGNNSFAFGQNCVTRGTASTALGHNVLAQSSYGTNVGAYNIGRNNTLFEIGNGTGATRSNIVEVNSTELNVNGEIKKNGVSLPTPYTTMPTITASMLGQIAMYVGETTNDYVKGYFYIASSDGAVEPTYSWVHLPTQNGYSETVLWEWQSSSDSHADVILSASFLAFDALMLISNAKAFLEGSFAESDGEGYTATVPISELVRHSGGTIVLGGSDVSGSSYAKYSFDTSSPTAITHKSHGSGTWAQTLRTVIGIKY